ncbi:MAG: cell division/cell wall cluster transcriptional repressor MraZ [Rickettsiales bacterium]|nr:cell division/cell wall cluster transcriptional repressor MraZ [Rickettsiales bacterium]|tara:strand:+ start:592 stop:1065 length:474 start_codon:yes stop_codon:yes gene_type:complete
MFQVRGQFEVRMDAKGRLPLPVRLRERMLECGEPGLVLAYWDGGLQGFAQSRWAKMERRFAGVSLFDRKSRQFLHAYVAGAAEVEADGQGRILVPAPLRRRAGLVKNCVVLSYLGLIEIWDAAAWSRRQEQALEAVQEGVGMEQLLAFDPEDEGEDL